MIVDRPALSIFRRLLVACAAAFCAVSLLPATSIASAGSPVPSSLPPQTYPKTYSEQQWITMDDGVQLGATITFPSKNGKTRAPGRFPVILSMTPYGRDGECACAPAVDFALRGFAVAVVDVRGTGGSQGHVDNYFSPREARDGYDLVQYLGTRKWSTGKVGMSGGSYVGITQLKTAETDPSHLAAIAPDVALADIYNDAFAPGGIMSLFFDGQYVAFQPALGLAPNTSPAMLPGTVTAKEEQTTSPPLALAYLENPFDDHFYRVRSPITQVANIHVPVFIEDGWRDALEAGDIRMFQALEHRRGVPTYLNVGPCTHKGCGGPFAPTVNPPNQDNVLAQEIRFDQRYLMGMKVPRLPRVRLYDQQANHYIDTTTWPPPRSVFQREYLGRGTIGPRPAKKASTQSYFANPAAGFSMTFDEPGNLAATPYVPTDQRLETGQGLNWRTSTLKRSLTLAGPSALRLVAASSATNTDWFAKISDVAPNGSESIVTQGQLRAALRALAPGSTAEEPLESLATPHPLKPGRFYAFQIAIAPTMYTFKPGHQLQIRITSGNLPNALPGTVHVNPANPASSFTPLPPATNTIRLGGHDGTSLLLPVNPR